MSATTTTYKHFLVSSPAPYVAHVEVNRPKKLNAFIEEMWLEMRVVFEALSVDPEVRAIIFSGAGDRAFTTGLDVNAASQGSVLGGPKETDGARKAAQIRRHVAEFQECVSSLEKCEKPVICVLHGFSFGMAIDLCTAADVRICSADTRLSIKEVDIGLAADVGTLARLPKVVGSLSWVKDVCLTARVFGADEALRVGLVSRVLPSKAEAVASALEIAALIASKSPVAVQGTKEILNHSRDHPVSDNLRYVGVWNSAALQTTDVERAILSSLKKTNPRFEKL